MAAAANLLRILLHTGEALGGRELLSTLPLPSFSLCHPCLAPEDSWLCLLSSLLTSSLLYVHSKPNGSAFPTAPLHLSSHAQTLAPLISDLPLPTGFFLGISFSHLARFHLSLLPLLG